MTETPPIRRSTRTPQAETARQRAVRIAKRYWYWFLQLLCRQLAIPLFRYRCFHSVRMRFDGPALVLSNHQSNLDPVLVGMACHEPLHYLARKSLFGFAPFRWLIASLDAIPLDREGLGLEGIKETLRQLKAGRKVVLFPEGRRTGDGEIAPLKSGFCALARRGSAALLPVGIDGAYDAWPRRRMFPRLAQIHVCVGEPISIDQVAQISDEQLVELVTMRMTECHAAARRSLHKAP